MRPTEIDNDWLNRTDQRTKVMFVDPEIQAKMPAAKVSKIEKICQFIDKRLLYFNFFAAIDALALLGLMIFAMISYRTKFDSQATLVGWIMIVTFSYLFVYQLLETHKEWKKQK